MVELGFSTLQQLWDLLQTTVLSNLIVLAIAFLTTGLAVYLVGRNRRRGPKMALRAEMRWNVRVTKAIMSYADSQLSGETSVAPMPMYRLGAFLEYAKAGMLERIPVKLGEELEKIYMTMKSVNLAGRRQEELAFGPAAAFPNAHTLRLENLTYARDTAHNIIEPYQDRLRDIRL